MDQEASVRCAQSDDLPGLVTEVTSFPELIVHVKSLVPVIIQENLGLAFEGPRRRGAEKPGQQCFHVDLAN